MDLQRPDQLRWAAGVAAGRLPAADVLLDGSADGLTVHAADGSYLFVSSAFERLLGLDSADLIGQSPFSLELFHPDDLARVIELQAAALEQRRPWRLSYRLRRADGAFVWVESAGGAVSLTDGDAFVVWTRDVGHLESLVRGLEHERNLKTRLDEVVAQQRAFLTAISHRSRTPLTAVLGMAQLLQWAGDRLDAERRTQLTDRLVVQAKQLAELLETVTDADKLARADVKLQRSVVDLRELVTAVVEELTADSGVVSVEVPERLWVVADRQKLRRMIRELLANAFQHGGIGVDVAILAATERDGVTITVEDTGPGIADALKPYAFDAFERGDHGAPDPGAGLGLHLVSEIAALHGGRTWVEDRAGGGARFRVHLPELHVDAEMARDAVTPTPEVSDVEPIAAAHRLDDAAHRFVTTLLGTVRSRLAMDVVYVSVFDGDEQVVIATSGDGAAIGITEGTRLPLHETYCVRMALGSLDRLVPDTARDPVVSHLPATAGGIACYAGVPVHLPTGHLFGSLCAAHSTPRPELTTAAISELPTFAAVLGDQLALEGVVGRRLIRATSRVTEVLAERTRLRTVLQPVVDLASGGVVGAEALSRFDGPDRPVDLWFADAARCGLLTDLELLAARHALQRLGDLPAGTYLSVNLGPQTILDDGFERLWDGVEVERVVVEISEHAVISDYAPVQAALGPLRSRGMRLAIDRAGAGPSPLRHVVRLRPDIIKVGGSVLAPRQGQLDRGLLRDVTSLAAELDAAHVAVGVQDPATLRSVVAAGFSHGQGMLLGPPADVAAVAPLDVDALVAGRDRRRRPSAARDRATSTRPAVGGMRRAVR